LDSGKLLQVGAPAEIYRHPCSRVVAEFIGEANFFTGRVIGRNEFLEVDLGSRTFLVVAPAGPVPGAGPVTVCLRPETILISESEPSGQAWRATLLETTYLGQTAQHLFRCGEDVIKVTEINPRPIRRPRGHECFLGVGPEDIILLPEK
jgi:ABC-type Fe3+/spermidine/putrescine transport system ATPase subunit